MRANTEELFLSPEELRLYKIKKTVFNVFIYLFLAVIALFIIIPFYYMILTAFQTNEEFTSEVISLWPKTFNLKNFAAVFENKTDKGVYKGYSIWTMYGSTIYVGILTTLGTIVTVVFSAFAFARLEFKGKEAIFSLLLATMMIPGEIYIITNYQTLSSMRNTYTALIIPFVTSVFYTFFLRQTFRQIPNELYLAARVDGLGDFGYLFKIMIPIAKSTIITIIILSMIGTWNAYVWPSLMTTNAGASKYLVSNGLAMMFKGQSELSGPDSIITKQMAASTLITIPLLITFICLRKYIMSGVSRSGIKG